MILGSKARTFRWRRALLNAAKKLYGGKYPYRPYAQVNKVLTEWCPKIPQPLACLISDDMRHFAELRLRQKVVSNALGTLVAEGIITTEVDSYIAAIPLPAEARNIWCRDVGRAAVLRSWWRFTASMIGHIAESIQKFRVLSQAKMRAPSKEYIVTVNLAPTIWEGAKANREGGFLQWLIIASPLAGKFNAVFFSNRTATPDSNKEKVPLGNVCGTYVACPFPALSSSNKYASFSVAVAGFALLSLIMLAVGRWQGIVLLPDIIELEYFRKLTRKELAKAYIFTLGDQLNRPLWTWQAERLGVQTPFVYFASSYSMFHYQKHEVPKEQRHPAVTGNCWTNCWVQTVQVRASMQRLLDHDPEITVVGPFDMVDDGSSIQSFASRSVMVFDVEPNRQLLRLSEKGYLCPFLTEDVVVDFWRELAKVAKELSLVLVHKPKRPNACFRESSYAALIAEMKRDGVYLELPTGVGPMRALDSATVSVILPFTSVGDNAIQMNKKAAFFDVRSGIANPDIHANGLPVLSGVRELRDWLEAHFEMQS